MTLVEPQKKGGRYSIKEKEERRIQVYHLRFEENKSAVKIAGLLGVSRNTINDDIAYWHSQLAHEFNAQNLTSKMTKQIQRTEMQRDRLLKFLEDDNFDKKFKIEKFISEIDNKLMQYYSKMILAGKSTLEPTVKVDDIDENEIKLMVRDLIFHEELEEWYTEKDLKFQIIRQTKSNLKHAQNILEKMFGDGLSLCREIETKRDFFKSISGDRTLTYNIEKFADLRGYVTTDELSEIVKKRSKLEAHLLKMNNIEIELNDKFGDKSQWPEEVLEKFESDELEDLEFLE